MDASTPFGQNANKAVKIRVWICRRHDVVEVPSHRVAIWRCVAKQLKSTAQGGHLRTVKRSTASLEAARACANDPETRARLELSLERLR